MGRYGWDFAREGHFCYLNIQGDTTFISSASDETQKVETRQAVQRIYCSNH